MLKKFVWFYSVLHNQIQTVFSVIEKANHYQEMEDSCTASIPEALY